MEKIHANIPAFSLFCCALSLSGLTGCDFPGSSSGTDGGGVRVTVQDLRNASGQLTDHFVYEYNSHGDVTGASDYDSLGVLKNHAQYTLNGGGKRVTGSTFSPALVLTAYSTYEYGDAGQMSKVSQYFIVSGAATTVSSYQLLYFTAGLKTKSVSYSSSTDAKTDSSTFSYDGTGRRISSEASTGTHYEWSYPSGTQIVITAYTSTNTMNGTRTLTLENKASTFNYLEYYNF